MSVIHESLKGSMLFVLEALVINASEGNREQAAKQQQVLSKTIEDIIDDNAKLQEALDKELGI